MITRANPQSKNTATSTFIAGAGFLLQRKCACGSLTSSLTVECAECKSRKRLQTKLAIGASNDPLEQEANRVPDQLLAAPANPAINGATPHIQRFTGQATGEVEAASASVDHVLASLGTPLEPTLRQDMEQRFGHDFSRVRVHSGGAAEQSAREMNANAYTAGHNIVFGAGQYTPQTEMGRRLLSHELTHVVQQQAGVNLKDGVGQAGDAYETHADAVADLVMEGKQAGPLLDQMRGSAGVGLMRKADQYVQLQGPGPRRAMNTASPMIRGDQMAQIDSFMKLMAEKPMGRRNAVKPNLAESVSLLNRLVAKLDKLDKALLGNSTQSWGAMIWGEESGQGSIATQASKDAKLWDSNDATELLELVKNVTAGMKGGPDAIDRSAELLAELFKHREKKNEVDLKQFRIELSAAKVSAADRKLALHGEQETPASDVTVTWTVPQTDKMGYRIWEHKWAFFIAAQGAKGSFYCVQQGWSNIYKVGAASINDALFPNTPDFPTPPQGVTYVYSGPAKFVRYLPKSSAIGLRLPHTLDGNWK